MQRILKGGFLAGYQRAWLSADLVAGLTLAAVAIPEAMGYTKIAGMPVITGIYTVALPAAIFALIGSSRHLVVGADSASAAILFGGVATLAAPASPQYVALAGVVALITGVFLTGARLLHLGFLADFLSRTALIGFLTGVGIQVAVSQLGDMLRISTSGSVPSRIAHIAISLNQIHAATAALAITVVIFVLGLDLINPRIPAALGALILSIAATSLLHWSNDGIRTVGSIAGGLPPLGIPHISWSVFPQLIGVSASIFVVVLAQSAATSRGFAQKYHEEFDENRDLVGLAAAELMAGFSGTFVVNGSPTKTAVVDSAGGKSQVAQLVSASAAVLVLLVATGLLKSLPNAVLAAIVFTIGVKLIDYKHFTELWQLRKDEFLVGLATLLVVVIAGVEPGIVVAVGLSVLDYVRRGYHPKDAVMQPTPGSDKQLTPVAAQMGAQTQPGTLVYRFDAALFFANADYFTRRLTQLINSTPDPVHRVILDFSPVADIDYTAGKVLSAMINDLQRRKITVLFAHAGDIRNLLDRYGITNQVGANNIIAGLREALDYNPS